jgi:hypothetical protein
MIYVISIFGGLFIVLSLTMLYVFYREQHFGTFLMGITYGLSGLLAITLPHWWPLVVGFVMVWLLRLMGMEQTIPTGDEVGIEKAEGESRKEEGPKTQTDDVKR